MAARKKKKKKGGINLLPQKEFESSSYGRVLKWVLTTFRYIVVSVEVVVIGGFLSRFVLDVRNTDLNDEIRQNRTVIESFSSLENDFRKTQQKISIFKEFSETDNGMVEIFRPVRNSLPEGVRLVSVTKEVDLILVQGESVGEPQILQYLSNLRAAEGLGEVAITRTETSIESPYVVFAISIENELANPDGS